MLGQDKKRKRATSWTDGGTVSQTADNADGLNQRDGSLWECVCPCASVFWRGDYREDIREMMFLVFFFSLGVGGGGGRCRWGTPGLQVPVDVRCCSAPHTEATKNSPLSFLFQLDLFSPLLFACVHKHKCTHRFSAGVHVLCSCTCVHPYPTLLQCTNVKVSIYLLSPPNYTHLFFSHIKQWK